MFYQLVRFLMGGIRRVHARVGRYVCDRNGRDRNHRVRDAARAQGLKQRGSLEHFQTRPPKRHSPFHRNSDNVNRLLLL
jgi:hypothetical protein